MPWKDPKRQAEYMREWRSRPENLERYRAKDREAQRRIRLSDPEGFNRRRRDRYVKQREIVFDHYGRVCVCCGEDNPSFLTIDHIDGGGSQHIKNEVHGEIYPWLIRRHFPNGFQVLCYNCNCAKRDKKECPHASLDYTDRWGIG